MEVRPLSIGITIGKKVRGLSIREIPHRRLTGTMSHGGDMSLPFRCSLSTVLVQSNQLSFRPCNSAMLEICSAPLLRRVCQVQSREGLWWAPRPRIQFVGKCATRHLRLFSQLSPLKSDPLMLLLLIRPPSGLHCHQTPPTHCQINGVLFQCRRPEDPEW